MTRNSLLYKETLSNFRQGVLKISTPSETEPLGILPFSVMSHPALTPAAKLVFAALVMESYRDGYLVAMSQNAIAKVTGLSRTGALAAVKMLEDQGFLKNDGAGKNSVQVYRIEHPRLKRGADTKATAKAPPKTVLNCAKCRRETGWLSKHSYCRRCLRDGEIRRIVREEVSRIA